MHDEEQWRQGLKVGDVVLIYPGVNSRVGHTKATVEKAQKLYITAGGKKFHRSNGIVVGYNRDYPSHYPSVVKPTDARMYPEKHSGLADKLRRASGYPQREHLTISQLERIVAILEEQQ